IVYKHTVRADGITETPFENPGKRVFGILYELTGNTASPVQFVLTDSTKHFFRGALYFDNVPNKDSIAPMSEYVREDIVHMMESFEWKK
ncbi:MAG: gliding motility lipoprotein GldD, partial [Paludibacteraceae bacterium]